MPNKQPKRRPTDIKVKGGVLRPVGNNIYSAIGRSHAENGMWIPKSPYSDIEFEGGETIAEQPDSIIIGSKEKLINEHSDGSLTPAVKPFGGNISPANAMKKGYNPEYVNDVQQAYKDRFNLNDDGTKRNGGKNKAALGDKEEWGTPQRLVAASDNRPVEVVVTPQGSYTGYMTSEDSPIYADNDARIAASEQGRMNRVNKQIADNERIKNDVENLASFAPILGEAILAKDIYSSLVNKNYGMAALQAAMPFVPAGVLRGGKGLYSFARNIPLDDLTRTALKHVNNIRKHEVFDIRAQNLSRNIDK